MWLFVEISVDWQADRAVASKKQTESRGKRVVIMAFLDVGFQAAFGECIVV